VIDYTPTKLEVRSQYANESFGSNEYLANIAEFDRWLETHNAEVIKETEERIIKRIKGDAGQKIMCLECHGELIALIKGENK
jgi:hypothetical protein